MQIAIDIAAKNGVSLQDQVVAQVLDLIRTGRLKSGTRLPGTRELSEQLGVSRNTVVIAYERLTSEGFVSSRGGAGTFVNEDSPDRALSVRSPATGGKSQISVPPARAKKPPLLPPYKRPSGALEWDFQLETNDPDTFPSNVWRRLLIKRTQSAKFNMTRYGFPSGLPELRESIAAHLGSSRGMTVDPEQLVIVTGIQQALNVVSRLFIRLGTPVVMEAPGCRTTGEVFRQYGANIHPVPVDQGGLIVEHLPPAVGGLAFVTPARQFPMGTALTLDRQLGLLDWARQGNSHVLEVDFDSDFRYDGSPPPAMQSIDRHDRVIYAGSFATSIGPGLRIGYLILPRHCVQPAIDALSLLDFGLPCYGVPWLEQAVLNDFIESGGFAAHLRRVRRLYRERRDQLMSSIRKYFPNADLRGFESGTHLAWHLPSEFPCALELQRLFRDHGIGVYTLGDHTVADAQYLDTWAQVLLLGFASQSAEKIDEGIQRIAGLMD